MRPAAGTEVVPGLRLIRRIGEGAVASVWLAQQVGRRERVAVKLLSTTAEKNRLFSARFRREAEVTARINSLHVVRIYSHGETRDGDAYIVMEHLEGQTLAERLGQDGQVPLEVTAAIVPQLGAALQAAHDVGVIHRDIKPANLFLAGPRDRPMLKVLDFGVAKDERVRDGSIVTETGVAVGSPLMMSPEQVLGSRDVDFRTDLWSFAVVVYRLVCGRLPFLASNPSALAYEICNARCPKASSLGAPPGLDAWFTRAFQPAKARRFPTAKEQADAFVAAVGQAHGLPGAWDPLEESTLDKPDEDSVDATPTALTTGEVEMVGDDEDSKAITLDAEKPRLDEDPSASTLDEDSNAETLQREWSEEQRAAFHARYAELVEPLGETGATEASRPIPAIVAQASAPSAPSASDPRASAPSPSSPETSDSEAKGSGLASSWSGDGSSVPPAAEAPVPVDSDRAISQPSHPSLSNSGLSNSGLSNSGLSNSGLSSSGISSSGLSSSGLSSSGLSSSGISSSGISSSGISSSGGGAVSSLPPQSDSPWSGTTSSASILTMSHPSTPPGARSETPPAIVSGRAGRSERRRRLGLVAAAALVVGGIATVFVVMAARDGGGTPTADDARPPEPTPSEQPTAPAPSDSPAIEPASTPPSSAPVAGVGKLSIICIPSCTDVRIENKSLGPSPVYDREIEAGTHEVVLQQGPRNVTRVTVNVEPGKTTTRQVQMGPPASSSSTPPLPTGVASTAPSVVPSGSAPPPVSAPPPTPTPPRPSPRPPPEEEIPWN
jgi:serine/threonine-protein kinase